MTLKKRNLKNPNPLTSPTNKRKRYINHNGDELDDFFTKTHKSNSKFLRKWNCRITEDIVGEVR